MKKYVIFTYVIGNMGGAQMYALNKIEYCQSLGYDVFLFPSEKREKIYIDALKPYDTDIRSELSYSPKCFPKKTVENMTEWFLKRIDYHEGDEVIIESHTIKTALWGEIFAERVRGKNFVFLMTEKVEVFNNNEVEFLRAKKSVEQLACISTDVMKKLFPDFPEEECIGLGALCGNTVQDTEIPERLKDIGNSETAIGVVGRLNKEYVKAAVDAVVKIAGENPEKSFELVLIGGSSIRSDIETLKAKTENVRNIKMHITDFIFPIPKKLLQKFKFCIAGAGSARAVHFYVPTISVDVYSLKAIGVLGYDTESTLSGNQEDEFDLKEFIEKVLFGDHIKDMSFLLTEGSAYDDDKKRKSLGSHFEFLKRSDGNSKYFSYMIKPSRKDRIGKILYFVGGMSLLDGIKEKRKKKRESK